MATLTTEEILERYEQEHQVSHGPAVELDPETAVEAFLTSTFGRAAGHAKAAVWGPGKVCDGSLRARNSSGGRPSSAIHLVIIHCTESPNPGARGVANYFHSSASAGSTQLVRDDPDCFRTLPDLVIPWGAPGANYQGVHIEQCGYTAWSRAQWLAHRHTIKSTAWHCATWCHRYDIPPRWLSHVDLRNGKEGISSHANVSAAWHRTDHSDPGHGYPVDVLMKYTKAYYRKMK